MNEIIEETAAFYEFQKKLDHKIYAIDENAFVDGIINFEKYSTNPVKILWILKEPSSSESGLIWRDEIKKLNNESGNLGAYSKTFSNIVYVTNGLLKRKKWSDVNWIKDEPKIVDVLEEIAFINIKKSPGGSVSNYNDLAEYYEKYKEITLEQIKAFKPNIIIGGNTIKFLINDLKIIYPSLKSEKYIDTTDLGIHSSIKDNLIVFDAWHPQYPSRERKNENYFTDIVSNYILLTKKSGNENN